MDLAYDHITEDGYAKKTEEPKNPQPQSTLNEDLQDAYKAFSNSPWGAKIGGFFGNVVKQGESVYTQASKELAEVGEDASKGLTGLRSTILSHTRNLSLNTVTGGESSKDAEKDQATTPTASQDGSSEAKQSENTLARLRAEAAKRLKDLQRAEDAADEALIKFGGNVRNFLRDAVSIAPPQQSDQSGTVLFESKDAQGKRVIHTSRFDAQLHVIHTSTESFIKDPNSADYAAWSKEFDADKKTPEINDDLQKFPDLRATMEKLVPGQVPYVDFWKRYYFLRHGIETAEARRRDLLKAASAEDDVAWSDDDSDDDSDDSDDTSTPAAKSKVEPKDEPKTTPAAPSTTTQSPAKALLKPTEPRKSNDEKSQADSEASYDVVGAASGKTTQTPNSPKDPKDSKKKEESSEEDDDSDDDSDSDEDWE
ncbi:DOS1 [Fusarium beomiforme]|uniref:DOS1 n=1 Tax=Fusarium beomiforme TaxID=44412 RepID=A0A9P5E682_9HYPO|nr:DOS1 [Fusarium beomiforme]